MQHNSFLNMHHCATCLAVQHNSLLTGDITVQYISLFNVHHCAKHLILEHVSLCNVSGCSTYIFVQHNSLMNRHHCTIHLTVKEASLYIIGSVHNTAPYTVYNRILLRPHFSETLVMELYFVDITRLTFGR
jgi:hypothetical protein